MGNDTTTQRRMNSRPRRRRRWKQHNPKGGRRKQHHTRESNTPTKKDGTSEAASPKGRGGGSCTTPKGRGERPPLCFALLHFPSLLWCGAAFPLCVTCVSPPTKNNQTSFFWIPTLLNANSNISIWNSIFLICISWLVKWGPPGKKGNPQKKKNQNIFLE